MSDSWWLQPTRLHCPGNFPGKNTGVAISYSRGSSQGLNPHLLESSNPRIKFTFLVSPASAGRFFTTAPPGKPWKDSTCYQVFPHWNRLRILKNLPTMQGIQIQSTRLVFVSQKTNRSRHPPARILSLHTDFNRVQSRLLSRWPQ